MHKPMKYALLSKRPAIIVTLVVAAAVVIALLWRPGHSAPVVAGHSAMGGAREAGADGNARESDGIASTKGAVRILVKPPGSPQEQSGGTVLSEVDHQGPLE